MLSDGIYLLPGERRVKISHSGAVGVLHDGAEQQHKLLNIKLRPKCSQQR